MRDDTKFKHPFLCIVNGPSSSGKSSFCIHFLQKHDYLFTETTFAGGIVWCYGEKSDVHYGHQLPTNVRLNEGVPVIIGCANGEPCLVILDDLLNDVYSKKMCETFTSGNHRRIINVILISQILFHQDIFGRDISLNAHYIVALKNV